MNMNNLINKLKKITIPRGYKLHIRNKKSTSIFNKFNIKQKISFKPEGVWSSGLEDSWIDYCINNDAIFLDKIDTIKKVKEFTNKYGSGDKIDWKKVKNDGYYGVNFSKYFKSISRDFKYLWYYSLNCSCQCIWDSRVIIDIKLLNML